MTTKPKSAVLLARKLATVLATSLLCGLLQPMTASAQAEKTVQAPAKAPSRSAKASGAPLAPCSTIAMAEPATITMGKSTLIKLPQPVVRLVVGGMGTGHAGRPVDGETSPPLPQGQQARPGIAKTGVGDADVMLLSPSELYMLGKRVGSMNLILQDKTNQCTVMDVVVAMDSSSLQAKLSQLMPDEKDIKVTAADDSLVLSGEVADAVKLERALTLAAAYAPDRRLVNLLRTSAASQVMLEVTVAEVSKTILDQLGASVTRTPGGSGWNYALTSNFLTKGNALLQLLKVGTGAISINAQQDDGIVRILAEPNIMAISGQQASFLSGGKVFIPVAQTSNGGFGGGTITLEEKEFGVGVRFTPTVLEGDRINLKIASEVSTLSQTGSPFTTVNNVTSVLPSFSTRKADTTVQLRDGQSFAIAGLIKNNLTESVKRFPGMGDIPVLGALFRSSEFQKDMTELVFVITPRLVKPLPAKYPLPTDNFNEPERGDMLMNGKLEGNTQQEEK